MCPHPRPLSCDGAVLSLTLFARERGVLHAAEWRLAGGGDTIQTHCVKCRIAGRFRPRAVRQRLGANSGVGSPDCGPADGTL